MKDIHPVNFLLFYATILIVATVVLGVTDRCGCPKSISHVTLRI